MLQPMRSSGSTSKVQRTRTRTNHDERISAVCPAWILLFEGLQEVHRLRQARVGSVADLRLVDDGSIGAPSFWEGFDALVEVAAIMPGQPDHDGGTVVLINELQQVSSAVHIFFQHHVLYKGIANGLAIKIGDHESKS